MTDQVAAAFDVLVGGGVERRELDRGGRMLRWLEAGAGPAVVLEAGAMSPVAGFAAVFKGLVPDHRVVAYDRAGYGASDSVPLDLQVQLGDLIAVLEKTGPAVVVGHSWGGLLAQLASWTRPLLISGLVLLDPSHESFWLDLDPEARRHPTTPVSEDPRSASVLEFGRELAQDIAQSTESDLQVQQLLIGACLSYLATDQQLFTYLAELPMILDHLDELAARRAQAVWPEVPITLLTATKGRPEDSTAQVIATQDDVAAEADARHEIVPDSGHYLHIDRPDLVLSCVRDVTAARRRLRGSW